MPEKKKGYRARTSMNTNTKHSVLVEGHKTSVSLEPEFWQAFTAICRKQGTTASRKIQEIDAARTTNLSSAIRLFVLASLRGND